MSSTRKTAENRAATSEAVISTLKKQLAAALQEVEAAKRAAEVSRIEQLLAERTLATLEKEIKAIKLSQIALAETKRNEQIALAEKMRNGQIALAEKLQNITMAARATTVLTLDHNKQLQNHYEESVDDARIPMTGAPAGVTGTRRQLPEHEPPESLPQSKRPRRACRK